MSLTQKTNQNNIEHIRAQIAKKNSANPYLANNKTVTRELTDMDHHPYTRWFRGVYYYPDPIVMEREAGWRPENNGCYDMVIPVFPEKHPAHCYIVPCSTVFPCFQKYDHRFKEMSDRDVFIDSQCIVQYR